MSSAPGLFTDKKYSVCILAAAGVAAATQLQQSYELEPDCKLLLREGQEVETASIAGMSVSQLLRQIGDELEQLTAMPVSSHAQRVKQTLYPWGNTSEQDVRRSIARLRDTSIARLNDKLTHAETGLIVQNNEKMNVCMDLKGSLLDLHNMMKVLEFNTITSAHRATAALADTAECTARNEDLQL
eukprot:889-Heterococcus_DN1.PRE.2